MAFKIFRRRPKSQPSNNPPPPVAAQPDALKGSTDIHSGHGRIPEAAETIDQTPQSLNVRAGEEDDKGRRDASPPVLSDEDEAMLERFTSNAGSHSSTVTQQGPREDQSELSQTQVMKTRKDDVAKGWSYFPSLWPFATKSGPPQPLPAEDSSRTLDEGTAQSQESSSTKKEKRDFNSILSSVNLSALNNRVVGVSEDTQKLLQQFVQILKDIMNGVPTAYDDLEKLYSEREGQLNKLYNSLPSFLQNLIATIPAQLWASMRTKQPARDPGGGRRDPKQRQRIPSLKQLLTEKGAVVAALQGLFEYLEATFPSIMAMSNVLWSFAVFLLMLVLWYCHKRGKESRLEQEGGETRKAREEDGPETVDGVNDEDEPRYVDRGV